MNNLMNSEITFYIRTAKKLGFIERSKKSALTCQQIKKIASKKTKIPVENQVIFYNGQKVGDNKSIKIVDKAIVHVVDSRNVGKSKMKLQVKRLSHTQTSQSFEVDSNSSIDEFIKKQIAPCYQEPAEKLFFVYSGRQLKKEKSFTEQYVENQTQIICVHQEKDKKSNKKTKQPKKFLKQNKVEEKLNYTKLVQPHKNEQKVNKKIQKQRTVDRKDEERHQPQNKDSIKQQKNQEKISPKNDPLDNFSETNSISEPNFKKKSKAKQVPTLQTKIDPENEGQGNEREITQNENKIIRYKTREQIFQSNVPTYASVINQPEDSVSFQIEENNKFSEMSFFMPNQGENRNNDQQIFDSGMNFTKQNNSKLEIKCNKGFMNLSNASFLENPRNELVRQRNNQEAKTNEVQIPTNRSDIYLSSPSLLDYSHSRTFQTRDNEQNHHYVQNPTYGQQNQQPKQNKLIEQLEEDNLFVQLRRGNPNSHHYQNHQNHPQISQSNLLSYTYQHVQTTDQMNSFTFNLEQNPDQTCIGQRQSNVQIVLEQSVDEEEVSGQVLNSKRESDIETNFKDSASPSQIQSLSSRNNFDFHEPQIFAIQTCSLIDNLMSIDDEKSNYRTENQLQKQKQHIQEKQEKIVVQYQQYRADTESQVHQFAQQMNDESLQNYKSNGQFDKKSQERKFYDNNFSNLRQNNSKLNQDSAIKILEDDSLSMESNCQQENLLDQKDKNKFQTSEADQCSGTFQEVSCSNNPIESNFFNKSVHQYPQEITFRKDQQMYESNFYEPQGSKLLHELSLLAQNETQRPELLPGDYIYSTDLVQTPEEALQSILTKFSHCF